jgi:LmbE family N-acetylglucosaminyl deacetylase
MSFSHANLAGFDPSKLGRRVTVLSPHLDDAVFSIGATISRATRSGVEVTVLTVFGGDAGSSAPAGAWDRKAGFATVGESASARRREDQRACSLVSATTAWQSFPDEQYEGPDDDTLANALAEALSNAETLLLPGFPLTHRDHARLSRLVLARGVFSRRIVLYAELPYALSMGRATVPEPLHTLVPDDLAWQPTRVGSRDIVLKARACRAYASQLPCFPKPIVWPMSRYELTSTQVVAPLEMTSLVGRSRWSTG